MAIWQDLVDEYGFAGSYQRVQRLERKLRGAQMPEAGVGRFRHFCLQGCAVALQST